MNGDLDRQLEEMGGEYRAVVDRLRSAAEVEPRRIRVAGGWRKGWLVAASLALVVGLGVVLWGEIGWRTADEGQQTKVGGLSTFDTRLSARAPLPTTHYPLPSTHYPLPSTHYPLPSTHYPLPSNSEYRLAHLRSEAAVAEMIRTQQADGGWRNDFLTRQNAEALKLCDSREAKIAYKKAMRNLRVKGVL